MTFVFDLQVGKVQIPADMPEWRERYSVPGPLGNLAVEITTAWRVGSRCLSADEVPKVLIAPKPRKVWPDAFTAVSGIYVVSHRAKDVIENFDPGLHQFFPLDLRTKRGVNIAGPWFAMNVTIQQASIVVEKSRVLVSKRAPDKLCSFFSSSTTKDVVVDASRLSSDIHLWREARFRNSLLGSDALIAAFRDAGVKFFPSYRATDLSKCA